MNKGSDAATRQATVSSWLRFGVLLLLILAAKSSLANWNYVPSGSMQPNLLIGDMIWVNNVAYDLRIPFTKKRLAWWAEPQRGDIVVAHSPQDDARIVKRVVATPGDRVEIFDQLIRVNGAADLSSMKGTYSVTGESDQHPQLTESVLSHQRTILVNRPPPPVPTRTLVLKSDEYFLMGDHRDNSLDSRYWGPIERQRILGKATHVVGSLDYQDSWQLRLERFFRRLN